MAYHNIVIPTVPHTGTLLIAHKFIELGYNHRSLRDGYKDWADKSVFVGHLVKPERVADAIYLCEQCPCVVPLRHPYLTYESWKRRGKELDNLISAWRYLVTFIDPFKPMYLPIDVPDRQDYLETIKRRLNINISMKWPVVNSKHGTDQMTYKDVKPNMMIKELTEELQPFLDRFYGSF